MANILQKAHATDMNTKGKLAVVFIKKCNFLFFRQG